MPDATEAPSYLTPGRLRKGWRLRPDGTWEPTNDKHERVLRSEPADELDESLVASHARMRRVLAIWSGRLEAQACKTPPSPEEIALLSQLAGTWRVLTANEPPPDLADMSTEQLKAQLTAVAQRGK
jgi:hypothetical protein